jgi:hypothetical protein
MHERGIAFDIAVGVLAVVGTAMYVKWRREPDRYLTYGSGVILLWCISLGLYYGITQDWSFGAGLWVMGLAIVAFGLLVKAWLKGRRA